MKNEDEESRDVEKVPEDQPDPDEQEISADIKGPPVNVGKLLGTDEMLRRMMRSFTVYGPKLMKQQTQEFEDAARHFRRAYNIPDDDPRARISQPSPTFSKDVIDGIAEANARRGQAERATVETAQGLSKLIGIWERMEEKQRPANRAAYIAAFASAVALVAALFDKPPYRLPAIAAAATLVAVVILPWWHLLRRLRSWIRRKRGGS